MTRVRLRASLPRVTLAMRRRVLPLTLALLSSACARQVLSTAPTPEARVATSGAPRAAVPTRGPLSSSETVNYILGRGLLVPVAGVALDRKECLAAPDGAGVDGNAGNRRGQSTAAFGTHRLCHRVDGPQRLSTHADVPSAAATAS